MTPIASDTPSGCAAGSFCLFYFCYLTPTLESISAQTRYFAHSQALESIFSIQSAKLA